MPALYAGVEKKLRHGSSSSVTGTVHPVQHSAEEAYYPNHAVPRRPKVKTQNCRYKRAFIKRKKYAKRFPEEQRYYPIWKKGELCIVA
jgi:hypothetical protein